MFALQAFSRQTARSGARSARSRVTCSAPTDSATKWKRHVRQFKLCFVGVVQFRNSSSCCVALLLRLNFMFASFPLIPQVAFTSKRCLWTTATSSWRCWTKSTPKRRRSTSSNSSLTSPWFELFCVISSFARVRCVSRFSHAFCTECCVHRCASIPLSMFRHCVFSIEFAFLTCFLVLRSACRTRFLKWRSTRS